VEEAITRSDKVEQRNTSHLALAAKRGLDIIGSLVLVVLLSPLFLVITIAIKLGTPGPVFYKRRVIGQGARPFMAFKFRSMVANAHDLLAQDRALLQQYQQDLKIVNDPRVTRVGRILRQTTLDELPQLLNVLKGDMSLVGPRMLGDVELARFGEYRDKVLSVKPGMAGLWVASGRHTLPFERRVELEMEYVDRWSLWLDIKILLKSALVVIRMVGAE
jgi:lipopolysaccharide/colanic/teichoic acid biosynthesis glycosyltransferase